jgi:hypothetical protein
MRLSSEHGDDADAYQDAKADFVGRVDTEAAAWVKGPAAIRDSSDS